MGTGQQESRAGTLGSFKPQESGYLEEAAAAAAEMDRQP